jgi:hypothetical protein
MQGRSYQLQSEFLVAFRGCCLLGLDRLVVERKKPSLALGDFVGNSLRVGPPTYRFQNRVDSIEAIINMPPKHRDLIRLADGAYERVEVLMEECADTPDDPGCTHAKHGGKQGKQSTTINTSQRDWSVGGGIESKVSLGGAYIDNSLEASYGEHLSEDRKKINSTTFSQYATAYEHDKIVFYGTPYHIWEYPVYADSSLEPVDYMTVMFPELEPVGGMLQSPTPDTMTGDFPAEPWYFPRHQTYNVWSYDPIGAVRFDDYDPDPEKAIIGPKTISGGGDWFEVNTEHGAMLETTTSQTHDFSTEMGAGYEGGADIPFVGDFSVSFRAYVNSSYAQEDIQTDILETSEATSFSAYIAEMDTEGSFSIRAYAYRANNGYLVLDYQTDMPPDAYAWQTYYAKPDPAFTLPWYGFPDPADPIPPGSQELRLFSGDIQIVPEFANVGDEVTISAEVRNFSNAPASDVLVRFTLGDPADGGVIGEDTIPSLQRVNGPQTASITWTARGAGKQKIYAVIDPDDDIDEVHDEDDLSVVDGQVAGIDNNVAYGKIRIGATKYVDMGLAAEQPYQSVTYAQSPSVRVSAYVPAGNLGEIVRFELRDAALSLPAILGKPFELLAYPEAEVGDGAEPDFALKAGEGDPPAAITVSYGDTDVSGIDEANLTLYRLTGFGWTEATCPGYPVHRFPEDNLIAVPVGETGVFALSDETPRAIVFLPLVIR